MSQHFLLTAAARTLSLASVARMSGEEAHAKFVEIRWSDNGGKPYCPRGVTSGTMFHSRKLPPRDYLLAIAIFVTGAKGHSALQLSRDLDCQYKTAFVLAHKLREAMGAEVHNPDQPELSDEIASTNQAESWFSRLRRAEMGAHHRISGRYLYQYANEMAWREDHRREPNGLHFRRVTGAALHHPKSEIWRGYWQRSAV